MDFVWVSGGLGFRWLHPLGFIGKMARAANPWDGGRCSFINPINAPYNPINAPYNPINAPYNPINAPYNPINAPYNPINAPYNPINAPYNPINAPYNPINAPYNPINAPYNPINAPYNPSISAFKGLQQGGVKKTARGPPPNHHFPYDFMKENKSCSSPYFWVTPIRILNHQDPKH